MFFRPFFLRWFGVKRTRASEQTPCCVSVELCVFVYSIIVNLLRDMNPRSHGLPRSAPSKKSRASMCVCVFLVGGVVCKSNSYRVPQSQRQKLGYLRG